MGIRKSPLQIRTSNYNKYIVNKLKGDDLIKEIKRLRSITIINEI
jgi:hypothetical protein